MQKTSCLYFPDTLIPSHDIVKLLGIFSNVTYYLPCEPDNNSAGSDACQAQLRDEKLLIGYPPAPLGPDLERFKLILREFTSAQYGASATSSQVIAALTASSQDGSEISSDQLIASIVGRPTEYTEAEQKEREELWSARLFLSLAEKRDEQERELQEGLHAINGNETTLFDSLKGEKNEMESILQKVAIPLNITSRDTAPSPALLRSRMKAWHRLFLADKQTSQEILITSRQECAATIIDTCRTPQEIIQLSLLLPVIKCDDQGWLEKLKTVRQALEQPAAEIIDTLLNNADQCSPAHIEKMMTEWQTSLKQLNQSEISGWRFLNLFCFPQSTREVLSQALRSPATPQDNATANRCIIGLLSAEPFKTT